VTESAHCGRKGCPCTHSHGCYKGWIDDMPRRLHNGTSYEQVGPCPQCKPELVERLAKKAQAYR
jgi:hypothetical protein